MPNQQVSGAVHRFVLQQMHACLGHGVADVRCAQHVQRVEADSTSLV